MNYGDERLNIEGSLKISLPEIRKIPTKRMKVFYNPSMEENRDVSVLMLQVFRKSVGRELVACDLMAGCGVRGLRWAGEVRGLEKVFLNDANGLAAKVALKNAELNSRLELVEVVNLHANHFLTLRSEPRYRFDVLDVDPFGSPAPHIDSSVKALKSRGLLSVTATDLAALVGTSPNACLRRYGGKPLKTEYAFENAVRLMAAFISRVAAVHDLGFNPLLCYYHKHYIRVYGIIEFGARKADSSLKNIGYISHCMRCRFRTIGPVLNGMCEKCGSKLSLIGPLWIGEIFDYETISSLLTELKTRDFRHKNEIGKMFSRILEECGMPPTHYVVDDLSSVLRIKPPKLDKVIELLKASGYRACRDYIPGNRLKTDAPIEFIKDVLT